MSHLQTAKNLITNITQSCRVCGGAGDVWWQGGFCRECHGTGQVYRYSEEDADLIVGVLVLNGVIDRRGTRAVSP